MNSYFKHGLISAGLAVTAMASQAQVAVIMGPSAAPITKDQLSNIYLGRSFDLKPVDLPEGSALRDQFYKKATDRDSSQIKATWSRIVFTGKGQAPIILQDAAAVKKAVISDPKAIGYVDKAAVDGSVKVVFSLD